MFTIIILSLLVCVSTNRVTGSKTAKDFGRRILAKAAEVYGTHENQDNTVNDGVHDNVLKGYTSIFAHKVEPLRRTTLAQVAAKEEIKSLRYLNNVNGRYQKNTDLSLKKMINDWNVEKYGNNFPKPGATRMPIPPALPGALPLGNTKRLIKNG